MKYSLKLKILFTIVALTVSSLSIFSYLSYQTYKKDKLAFIYDYMASETQSKSTLISSIIEQFDFLSISIISQIDSKTNKLQVSTQKFLRKNQKILGVYYHHPGKASENILHVSSNTAHLLKWKDLHLKEFGPSVVNQRLSLFIYKKPLKAKGGYVMLLFQHPELMSMLNSGLGRVNFLINQDQLISKNELPLSRNSLNILKDSLVSNVSAFGLFESKIENEDFFVSYSRLSYKGMILVSLVRADKVLLIQKVFVKQLLIFLLLMGSVSIFVGTLSSNWITLHLDDLTRAATEMEKENFNYVVKVRSSDEFGILSDSFNSMSSKIRVLLAELRNYNVQLELMVEERTRELQDLTGIQKAMLNSLGQGFVIVDKEGRISPIYSKVALEMFEGIPNDQELGSILGLNPKDFNSYHELFDLVFKQILDFDDMVKMNPTSRNNSKQQHIQLDYAPIKNENGELDYVLIIGTDKTKELESIAKLKKEWTFSQMIMRVVSNRYSLLKIIQDSFSMINQSLQILECSTVFQAQVIQRYVHTIKGSFSYFYIEEIIKLADEFETYLEPFYFQEILEESVKFKIAEKLMALQVGIECYIDTYDKIIHYKNSNSLKTIKRSDLDAFGLELRARDLSLFNSFHSTFYSLEIKPYFQMYSNLVSDLGLQLNKKVHFVLEGEAVVLPERDWQELFGQFIHFVRNSVDHGIESEEERLNNGKEKIGVIKFSFKLQSEFLLVELSDDGRGIEWQQIAKKDPTITSEAQAIERLTQGGISSKTEVSHLSGRGVGISSIVSKAKEWNGEVEFINMPGQGFKMKIRVPLKVHKNLKEVA